jgi:hypothetical protein
MATEPLPHLETPAVASHALGLANGHPQNADDRQRWNKIIDEVLVNWRRRPESCGALWSAKCQASEAPDDGKQERNGTMELIDALVNANSAPKLIKSFGASRPLFSREYNWAEQSRVRKVFFVAYRSAFGGSLGRDVEARRRFSLLPDNVPEWRDRSHRESLRNARKITSAIPNATVRACPGGAVIER